MKKLFLSIFGAIIFAHCVPYEPNILTVINLNLQDPKLQKIYSFQDQQLSDSLYQYFWLDDPSFRFPAAMAFANIQDSLAIDSLAILLSDPVDEVRAAAAFAIGQIGNKKGELLLLKAFDQGDTIGRFKKANAAILEAVGKCGTQKSLEALASISTYLPKDTALLSGQAYGIYRFSLRQITTEEGTERMVKMAINENYPDLPRMVAAHYLARTSDIDLSEFSSDLVRAFTKEKNPNIRMALAGAIGKTKTNDAREILTGLLSAEPDYRVKCQMIKALNNFEYDSVKVEITNALINPNLAVATTAAQFFIENGSPEDARNYVRIARDSMPWQVQLKMNAAALRHLPYYMEETIGGVNYRVRRQFETSENQYEKAAAIEALAEFGWNYRLISENAMVSDFPIVRTTAIRSLAKIVEKEDFERFFGLGANRVRREIAMTLQEGINNGDVGIIAEAAIALKNKDNKLFEALDSLYFLDAALAKLKLPAQIETYNALNETIYKLNYRAGYKPIRPKMNNPIRWENLSGVTEKSKATIRTKKGNITIELMPNEAPGSVANFARLARERFYNNKNFHRVVPNFVVQGGCSRGDGYGSLDYSIRSEFSMVHYDDEGYIGMASAGKDTEGTQFFITHSPTPHLDGRYTIFGKVVDGMNVVHSITEGDLIEKIEMDF